MSLRINVKGNKRNSHIDYLRATAAILVIFGHVLNYYNKNYSPLGVFGHVVLVLAYAVHVPLFFVISGYLLHEQGVSSFYKKKVIRVIIPFLFFTALKILFSIFMKNEIESVQEEGGITGLLINGYLFGNTYWFAYTIFSFYLLSPIIWKKDSRGRPLQAIIVFIVAIIANIVFWGLGYALPNVDSPFQLASTIFYLPFFILGYLINQYRVAFTRICKHKWIVSLICAVMICLALVLHLRCGVNSIGNKYPIAFPLALSLMLLLYYATGFIRGKQTILNKISSYSYQLMLLDSFYKVILFRVCSLTNIGVVLVIFLFDMTLGVISCEIVKKIPFIRVLFGI